MAHLSGKDADDEPYRHSGKQDSGRVSRRQELPYGEGESCQPKASESSAARIQSSRLAPADRVGYTGFELLFVFMFFNECCTGRKDRRKGEKKSSDDRAVVFRQHASGDRNRPTK